MTRDPCLGRGLEHRIDKAIDEAPSPAAVAAAEAPKHTIQT